MLDLPRDLTSPDGPPSSPSRPLAPDPTRSRPLGPGRHQKGGPVIDDIAEGTISITVDTTSHPGRTLIDVGGELDMLTAPQLRDALLQHVAPADGDVIVRLDDVDFLASTGLGVLVEVAQHAQTTGARLRLVCASRTVLRPLELTGLDQVFDIYPSLDDLDKA